MTARYVVRGRVQGVGFRWFVMRAAGRIGVTGYVRNQADGTVEVLAAGSAQQLAELEAALNQGPRLARVEGVEKSHVSHQVESLKSFEVR